MEPAADDLELVVIDGIGYTISSGSGEPGYTATGAALSALARVAADTGCAILGLTHPPKGSSDPTTAAIGSTGWTALPRVTWVLGPHPDDEQRRVVSVAKSNYKKPDTGWAWPIASDERYEVGYVSGVERCDVTAGDITAPPPAEERSERDEAAAWLSRVLTDGRLPSRDLEGLAAEAGISHATLHRARPVARVVIERDEHARGRPQLLAPSVSRP